MSEQGIQEQLERLEGQLSQVLANQAEQTDVMDEASPLPVAIMAPNPQEVEIVNGSPLVVQLDGESAINLQPLLDKLDEVLTALGMTADEEAVQTLQQIRESLETLAGMLATSGEAQAVAAQALADAVTAIQTMLAGAAEANAAQVDGLAVLEAVRDALTAPLTVTTDGALPVTVDGTVQVAGTVTTTPTGTQVVSGTVAVSNLPATQPVSGSVEVANDSGNPLPVSGTVAVSNLPATQPVSGTVGVNNFPASQAVTGPLTDGQLRATPVPVSGFPSSQAVTGPLTDTQLRASAVPVSGPATDTQLRATALPVSGPATDAQLRATALPVSGPATDAQMRATPIPVQPPQPSTGTPSSVTVGTSTATLSAANAGREGGTIFNEGSGVLYVLLGPGASLTAYSYRIITNGMVEIPNNYTGIVTAVSASSSTVRVTALT